MIERCARHYRLRRKRRRANMVLVPGSCSTGAAWRPVMASWNGEFRCVTTSLPGYGGTAERRPAGDPSIAYLAEVVETVVRTAGEPVHLVGHSFGGLVSLAVALRNRVRLASIAMLEPPGIELLLESGEDEHYRAFGRMSEAYVAAFSSGERNAIAAMIDFYGGAGTFASWPSTGTRVRSHDNGREHHRLGERIRLPVVGGCAVGARYSSARRVR